MRCQNLAIILNNILLKTHLSSVREKNFTEK